MRFHILFIVILLQLGASAQMSRSKVHDFGKVKDWNNPTASFSYTNRSGEAQLFLPTMYSSSFKITTSKEQVSPGETVEIKIQYFTEELGKFEDRVAIYVSNSNTPLEFVLKGKILSLHPDALTICPRIDNTGLQTGTTFHHRIRVVDKATGEGLTDYSIEVTLPTSTDRFTSYESSTRIQPKKPGFVQIEVDKEGYKLNKTERYVSRYTSETVVMLEQEEQEQQREEQEQQLEEQVVQEEEQEEEGEEEDPVQQEEREYFDFGKGDIATREEVKKEEIKPKESTAEIVLPADTATFDSTGSLNPSLFKYNNIVFLIDVSSSMRPEDKLPLLQESMQRLIEVMRPEDRVTIITYSSNTTVVVNNVSGASKRQLSEAIGSLQAKGSSFGEEGLQRAYQYAQDYFIPGGNNEIILASDGIFNSKNFSQRKVYRQVSYSYVRTNVRLSTIGFGHSVQALNFMEKMAKRGRGSFITIKKVEEADAMLIDNMILHSSRR